MATKKKESEIRELVVVGGGPGGYVAAFKAADLGVKVTLIDPEKNPGGVCLYRGCIPTKALLHLVKTKRAALKAAGWGLDFGEPAVDLKAIRKFKEKVVKKLTGGVGSLLKQRKITHIRGTAAFTDKKTLFIDGEGDQPKQLEFEKAIIATGSRPLGLPNLSEFTSDRLMYAEDALELPEIPETLLVVGAGYIGLELATVYGELGAEVTITEITDQLMPGSDRELIKIFEKENKKLFKEILLNTRVVGMSETDGGIEVRFENEEGEEQRVEYEKVLLTVGRGPNTEKLRLDTAGVETDEKGFVVVDEARRSSNPDIFAIGDVTGPPLLAHKASHEGIVAAEVVAGGKSAYDPRGVPAVEYCDPEIAWCGMSEEEAREAGFSVKVSRFPWAASGRATTMDRSDGLTKLIIDRESERILGAGIVGKDAGELIPEAALAIEMAALASDVADTIHPHPTLSETIMEAAEGFYGSPTHIYRPDKKENPS